MTIDGAEKQPKSAIDIINEREQQKIQSGELRETEIGTFRFSYLSDPRYQNASPTFRAAFEQLNIPEVTVMETEKAVKDLKIKKKVTVKTIIPDTTEMKYIIPSLGIGGGAFYSDEVRLYHDPNNQNVIASLKKWRKSEIAHELNHIARVQAGRIGSTLLDALVSEGLATYYQEHWDNVYQQTPWGHVLDENELIRIWKQAQPELHSNRFHHGEWFFGYEGKYPIHAGYSLGTAIVDKFTSKHPGIHMSRLVRMSSAEILKKSGFS